MANQSTNRLVGIARQADREFEAFDGFMHETGGRRLRVQLGDLLDEVEAVQGAFYFVVRRRASRVFSPVSRDDCVSRSITPSFRRFSSQR